jgi:metal-responsive CopG/Arc/MetJ family transcriptional regulator
MPSKKPQILLVVDDDLFRKIDDYRFENRINSRSEAVRQLIKEGLKKSEKTQPKKK